MRRIKFLTPLFVISSFVTVAQNRPLTMKEAIDLAVKNSKELKISKANIEMAQAKLAQAKDQALPTLKASGMYLRLNKPTVTPAHADAGSGSGGGSGSNPMAIFSQMNSAGLAMLQLTEPIFSGFKIRNNRIMQGYLAEAAQYDDHTTRSKIMTNTVRALYQYYELLENKKLIEKNEEQVRQLVDEFTNKEKQGVLAKNDVLKAELQLNNVLLTLTDVNNNIKVAEFTIQILLGLPTDKAFVLDTTGMFPHPAYETAENYETIALDKRSEVKAAFLQMKASDAALKMAKADYYPSIALMGGYANIFIPNVANVTNVLNGGLSLNYNITGLIYNRHHILEYKARQHQIQASSETVTDQIKVDVHRKYLDYQKSLEKIALTEKSIIQAEENYQISKNKFNNGLMITSDYLEAYVLLLQTQINYTSAKSENRIAWYELQQAAGTIE
ncbi:MAG: TolC family protein [Bacteroidetes bacterium]|nr:TolC family protein [Bacteroidota bacterium]